MRHKQASTRKSAATAPTKYHPIMETLRIGVSVVQIDAASGDAKPSEVVLNLADLSDELIVLLRNRINQATADAEASK